MFGIQFGVEVVQAQQGVLCRSVFQPAHQAQDANQGDRLGLTAGKVFATRNALELQ